MVTAIIVNYHSHRLTARAAASVLADQPDAQVIVIDNSVEPAEEQALRAVLPAAVELVVAPENLGFGKACNLGYARARHALILLLNPDAYLLKGCLGILTDVLRQIPDAAAVAPNAYWDEELKWVLPPGHLPTPATEFGMALALRWPQLGRAVSRAFRRWSLKCLTSAVPVRQRMLSGGHMLLRRSAVEAAGGLFDPSFFMYYEDTELCLRLQQAGFSLYLVPTAAVVHEWCATSDKGSLSMTSRHHYFAKHFSGSTLLRGRDELMRRFPGQRYPVSEHLGCAADPMSLSLPAALSDGHLIELSPHPLFVPAIYYKVNSNYFSGESVPWHRLGAGTYWLRSSGPRGSYLKTVRWEIAGES